MSAAPPASTAPGAVLLGAMHGRAGAPASAAARDRAAAFDAALTTADRMLGADGIGAGDARGVDEEGTTIAGCGDASESDVSTPAGAVPALTDTRPGEEREKPSAISSPPAAVASILAVATEAPTVVVTDAVSTTASGGTSAGGTAAAVGAASATAAGRTTAEGTPESDAETPALLLAAQEDAAAGSAAAAPRTGTEVTHESPAVAGGSAAMPASGEPTAAPAFSASGAAPMSAASRQDLRTVSLPTAPGVVGGAGDDAAPAPSAPSANVEVPAEVAPGFSPRSEFPARAAAEPGGASVPAAPTASTPSAAPVLPPGIPSTASVSAPAAPNATTTGPQPLAAQVAPAVLHLAQRPAGSHQLTMTIEPESLGPVTVRAHISADGEVQVHLLGATDAGREALRTLLGDLRRDLAAISPHASVALGAGADAGGGAERGPSSNTEQAPRDHDRGRGAPRSDTGTESGASLPAGLESTPSRPTAGAGLDIFA